MNTDDLEMRLSRQPLRPPPPQWRGEILAACGTPVSRPAAVGTNRSGDRRSVPWWLAWLVPGRAGWATLGAAWGAIVVLRLSDPGTATPQGDAASVLAGWQHNRQMLADFIELPERHPKPDAVTRPRGERRRELTTAIV